MDINWEEPFGNSEDFDCCFSPFHNENSSSLQKEHQIPLQEREQQTNNMKSLLLLRTPEHREQKNSKETMWGMKVEGEFGLDFDQISFPDDFEKENQLKNSESPKNKGKNGGELNQRSLNQTLGKTNCVSLSKKIGFFDFDAEDENFAANFNSQEVIPMSQLIEKSPSNPKMPEDLSLLSKKLSYRSSSSSAFLKKRQFMPPVAMGVGMTDGNGKGVVFQPDLLVKAEEMLKTPEGSSWMTKPQDQNEEKAEGKRSVKNKENILNKLYSLWDDEEAEKNSIDKESKKEKPEMDSDDFLMPGSIKGLQINAKNDREIEEKKQNEKINQRGTGLIKEESLPNKKEEDSESLWEKEECFGLVKREETESGVVGFMTFAAGGNTRSIKIDEEKIQKALSFFGEDDEPPKKRVKKSETMHEKDEPVGFVSFGKQKEIQIKEETLDKYKNFFEENEENEAGGGFELKIPKRIGEPRPFKPPLKNRQKEDQDEKRNNKESSRMIIEKEATIKIEERDFGKINEEEKRKEGTRMIEESGRAQKDLQVSEKAPHLIGFSNARNGGLKGFNAKTMGQIKKIFGEEDDDLEFGSGVFGFQFGGFKEAKNSAKMIEEPRRNKEKQQSLIDIEDKGKAEPIGAKFKAETIGFGFSTGGMKKIELNEKSLAQAQKLFDFGESQPTNSLEVNSNALGFDQQVFFGLSKSNLKEFAIPNEMNIKREETSMIIESGNDLGDDQEPVGSGKHKRVIEQKKKARGQFNFKTTSHAEQSEWGDCPNAFSMAQLQKGLENIGENSERNQKEHRNWHCGSSMRPESPFGNGFEVENSSKSEKGALKMEQNQVNFRKGIPLQKKEEIKGPKRETIGLSLKEIYDFFPKIEKMSRIHFKKEQKQKKESWMANRPLDKEWKSKMIGFNWKNINEEISLICWCDFSKEAFSNSPIFSTQTQTPDKFFQTQNNQGNNRGLPPKYTERTSAEKEMEIKRNIAVFKQCRCGNKLGANAEDLFDFFLYLGFDERKATHEWFMHHFKKVVFKFLSYSLSFRDLPVAKELNAQNVIGEMVYRYHTEFERGKRSVIQEILQGDQLPTCHMVLQIQKLIFEGEKITLELSDGWYSVWAEITKPKSKEGVIIIQSKSQTPSFIDGNSAFLCSLVERKKIFIGRKIHLAGCGFWGKGKAPAGEEIVEGNPIRTKKHLDIFYNSISPGKPKDKLGLQKENSMVKSLRSIRPFGGSVCGLGFYVLKKTLFMERFLFDEPNVGVVEVIRPFESPDQEELSQMSPQEKSLYSYFGVTVCDPSLPKGSTIEIYFMNFSRDDVYDAIGEGDFMVVTMLRTSYFVKSLNNGRNCNSYSFQKGKKYQNHVRLFADSRFSQLRFHRKASLLKSNWHGVPMKTQNEERILQDFVVSEDFLEFVELKNFIYQNRISGYFRLDCDDGKAYIGSGITCNISILKVKPQD